MIDGCIVFDMDGTLVDSKKNITSSVNHTRQALGFEPISEEMIYKYINIPYENLALRFYGEEDFSDETKQIFYKHYIDECVKDLYLYDGILEVLEFFKGKVKIAIATNAYDIFAIKMMKHMGLDGYFDLIVGANSTKASKPDAKMVEYIINQLHVDPNKTIIIGDSQKDELCAKNASIHFIFAAWGYGYYKSDEKYLCENPHELKKKILKILNT